MKSTRLLFRLLPTYLIILVLVSIILLGFSLRGIDQFNRRQTAKHLLADTRLAREAIYKVKTDNLNYEDFCYEMGVVSETRFTIIDLDGNVLGDTYEEAAAMELHADRPEFIAALNGENGEATRYSRTLLREMMYVAIPVWENGRIGKVIRASLPLERMRDSILPIFNRLIWAGILSILIAMVVSYFVARRITSPLEEIRSGAERIARGEFRDQITHFRISELDSLADSMNLMARELQQRIATITNQRNEQQAVLASMVEGVLAVDTDEKILRINTAAARLFNCDSQTTVGQIIPAVIRNADLQEFIEELLEQQEAAEKDIKMIGLDERYIRVSGAPMRDSNDNILGAVVVLNDISRLKKLETLRQEFVGNVAHEIKTPLTSIKGFVETLQGGALEQPEEARRFLDIIGRQADRLNVVLEDLLRLSKIERQREHSEIVLEKVNLRDILDGSVRDCETAAMEKAITVTLECEYEIIVLADPILLRQAITNLIDNAIKYSGDQTAVRVTATNGGDKIEISVADQGIGIADQHIPRLFERFYRVDKGRSRKAGGTGLGLAIVKHIVLAHNGIISVASRVDEGSIFTIELPVS